MKRDELELMISRDVDGELSEPERAVLAKALAESPEHRILADDLRRLKELAARRPASPESVLANKLQARVDQTYRRQRFPLRLAAPALAMAAALALALVSAFFGARQETSAPVEQADAELFQQIHQTQLAYHIAVASLERLAMERIVNLPAVVAHEYADGWRELNQAIVDHEALVEQTPYEYSAHESLSSFYQAKIKLLSKIIKG